VRAGLAGRVDSTRSFPGGEVPGRIFLPSRTQPAGKVGTGLWIGPPTTTQWFALGVKCSEPFDWPTGEWFGWGLMEYIRPAWIPSRLWG